MNDVAQVITALATLVASVGAMIVSLRNSRRADQRAAVTDAKIEEVHKSTNGKMDQLVAEVREASFKAGEKAEKDKR